MATEPINPVSMVSREMKARYVTPIRMGALIDRDPSSVHVMLTKNNMSVERLLACSRALKYNFFLEIGYQLNYSSPVDTKGNPLSSKVNILNAQIADKDKQIDILQKELNDTKNSLQKLQADSDVQRRLLETELNTLKQVMKDLFASRQV